MDNAVVNTNIPAIICTLYHITFIKKHFLNLLRRTGPLCHLVIYIRNKIWSHVGIEAVPPNHRTKEHTIVPLI